MNSWESYFLAQSIRPESNYRAVAFWTVTAVFFLALFTLAIIGLNVVITS